MIARLIHFSIRNKLLVVLMTIALVVAGIVATSRIGIDAIPDLQMTGKARVPVAGEVPNPLAPPAGCAFHPRCPHANERCRTEQPELIWRGEAASACHAVEENRI